MASSLCGVIAVPVTEIDVAGNAVLRKLSDRVSHQTISLLGSDKTPGRKAIMLRRSIRRPMISSLAYRLAVLEDPGIHEIAHLATQV